jgi:hypothetical protein
MKKLKGRGNERQGNLKCTPEFILLLFIPSFKAFRPSLFARARRPCHYYYYFGSQPPVACSDSSCPARVTQTASARRPETFFG